MSIPGVGGRREAREEALSFLYETELTGASAAEGLAARVVALEDYAVAMIEGIEADRDGLAALVGDHLTGWRFERMPIVDRVIALMGAWELRDRPDIPTGVVLSEAVELATTYCAEESPRFLNGVLRAIANDVRPGG